MNLMEKARTMSVSEAGRKAARARWDRIRAERVQAPPSSGSPVKTLSVASVEDAAATVLAQRVADAQVDAATGFGPIGSLAWKRARKIAAPDAERDYGAYLDGTPGPAERANALEAVTRHVAEPADDAGVASVEAAVAMALESPAMQAAVAKFGPLAVVPAESLGGMASGRCGVGFMVVSTGSSTRTATPAGNGLNVDSNGGVASVVRHEYGHHVQRILDRNDGDGGPDSMGMRWSDAHRAWGAGNLGPAGMDRELDRMIQQNDRAGGAAGLSLYARTNSQEAFAETFSLVTHPKFDRAAVDPKILPMVDFMLEVIG